VHDGSMTVEVERCAALLSARLEEVGTVPAASPAQRLARAVARLAALSDPEGVVRETLSSSLELSGYESGVVALADGHGALYPHVAEGPFAVALGQLAADELAAIAGWVDEGTSCYTIGDAGGRGFGGHEVLRRLGASSLIVLPLAVAGERLGALVLADRANRRPAFEDVELLELLANQAAASLRMASAVAALRERVSRDPLTGLHASLPILPARSGRRDRRRRRAAHDQPSPRPGRRRRRPALARRAAARADAGRRARVPDRRRRVRGDARSAAGGLRRAARVGAAQPRSRAPGYDGVGRRRRRRGGRERRGRWSCAPAPR